MGASVEAGAVSVTTVLAATVDGVSVATCVVVVWLDKCESESRGLDVIGSTTTVGPECAVVVESGSAVEVGTGCVVVEIGGGDSVVEGSVVCATVEDCNCSSVVLEVVMSTRSVVNSVVKCSVEVPASVELCAVVGGRLVVSILVVVVCDVVGDSVGKLVGSVTVLSLFELVSVSFSISSLVIARVDVGGAVDSVVTAEVTSVVGEVSGRLGLSVGIEVVETNGVVGFAA